MPLIVVANSPHKDEALAGLERWKSRHSEAAAHLAVDDVLVDAMRGRSSTWTRIRINLRNVPEALRPTGEAPDPDEDPTRSVPTAAVKRAGRKKTNSGSGRTHVRPRMKLKRAAADVFPP